MKKSAWIALGILAALAGLFFVIRDEPQTRVQAPLTIEPVKEMSRVEIVPPNSQDGGELIVLKREDATWKMTRPVESELSPSARGKLAGLFSHEIRTDDMTLSLKKKEEYGLDEASAVKLSAYSEGSDDAALELVIGKEISIPQTGARRTYIKKSDRDEIYRAQAALGDFVRQSADELRSKSMVDLDPEAISEVTITHNDGAKTQIARQDDAWTLVSPQLGAEAMNKLDQTVVKRLLNTLSRIRAAGFADDKKPEEAGLEPARVSIELQTVDDKRHVLELGGEAEGGKVYARFDDGAVFTVGKSVSERLSLKGGGLLETKEEEKAAREEKAEKAEK